MTEHDLELRVRYNECDPMGVAHHSAYPVWLEIARTDMLRASGPAYSELEARGVFFVVVRLSIHYLRPARYDDLLHIKAAVTTGAVKVRHEYTIRRDEQLLAEAQTTLACLDHDGKARHIPAGVFNAG